VTANGHLEQFMLVINQLTM